ncbi:MAG TPA: DUF5703 domain-containing protein [Pirellulales bacterium]|nr:DUF5703 domain-containing protein [Pirellulales bacterium]
MPYANLNARTFGLIFLLLFCSTTIASENDATATSDRKTPDLRSLIASADLTFETQVPRTEAGLPVGNGRMGTLVWTSPESLHLQINRGDVFSVDSYCNETVDYSGGCARIDIRFPTQVFPADNVRQHLSAYEGVVTVEGQGVTVTLFAWPEYDVIGVRIDQQHVDVETAEVDLQMLRPSWTRSFEHEALSRFQLGDDAVLTQRFHQPHYAGEYICRSAVAISVDGRDQKIEQSTATTAKMKIGAGKQPYTLWIGSSAAMDDTSDLPGIARQQCAAAVANGYEAVRAASAKWWQQFWTRSYVDLHSEDGRAAAVESAYHYYLYVMASTSRGKFPAKFNGMLWATGGDRRRWGSNFWWWNTQTLNLGLMAANQIELTDPLFDMYTRMFDAARTAARQQWGSQGIFIAETVPFNGPEVLPEDIAEELRDFLLERTQWHQTTEGFRKFVEKRNGYSGRWNFTHAPQAMPHSWISHILSSQAQIAWHYWQRYLYTQDEAWLRERAYPMIRGVAQFYRHYPNVKKGDDGYYHIHGVNNHESTWGGQDSHFELTAMMGILPLAVHVSQLLDVDQEMRGEWTELLENLTPLPTNRHPRAAFPWRAQDKVVWTSTLLPAKNIHSYKPGSQAFTHFDLINLETPPGRFARRAKDTYETFARRRRPLETSEKIHAMSLDSIMSAHMGDAEAVEFILPDQMTLARHPENLTLPNRMTLREGEQGQTVEHLGPTAFGLQESLVQAPAAGPGSQPVLRLFAACPSNWDASFRLLTRGGFLVRSSRIEGEIRFVEIESPLGGLCRVRNPWPDQDVVIEISSERQTMTTPDLIELPTKRGDVITLTRSGTAEIERLSNESR